MMQTTLLQLQLREHTPRRWSVQAVLTKKVARVPRVARARARGGGTSRVRTARAEAGPQSASRRPAMGTRQSRAALPATKSETVPLSPNARGGVAKAAAAAGAAAGPAADADPSAAAELRRGLCAVRAARVALAAVYVLVALLSGLGIWTLVDHGAQNPHAVLWAVGAMACAVALPLALYDIIMHVLHYARPELQRHVLRILGMVPVYALESWFALRFPAAALPLESLRECYEALVLWSFYKLLLSWLGDTDALKWRMREARTLPPGARLLFPLCWFSWAPPGLFLYRCGTGILQYVYVRLLVTAVSLGLFYTDYYSEGDFDFVENGYIWCAGILLVSQCWALYCLLQFYWVLRVELGPLQPVLKFAVVKSIIFATFYQQLLISLLVGIDVIKPVLTFNARTVAKGLQDFIICLEMAVLAVLMHLAFNYQQFVDLPHGVAAGPAAADAINAASAAATAATAASPGDSDDFDAAAVAAAVSAAVVGSTPSSDDAKVAMPRRGTVPDLGAGLQRALFDMLPTDIVRDSAALARNFTSRHALAELRAPADGAADALLQPDDDGWQQHDGAGGSSAGEGGGGGGGGGGDKPHMFAASGGASFLAAAAAGGAATPKTPGKPGKSPKR